MAGNIRVLHYLWYVLWFAQPLLEAGICGAMLWRGLHRQFKFFFAYVVSQILIFAVTYPVYHNSSAYFFVFWFSNAISVIFGFAVIHEVFLDVFRVFHTLRDLGTVLFKWAGLVMLLVAAVVSVSSSSTQFVWWMQAIVTTQRCVRIIQVGLVLLLLFFARHLGVSRKQHSFGIALGFGTFAIMELTLVASWTGQHMSTIAMNMLNMAAYDISLLTWAVYMVAKSPAREATTTLLKPQRWEQSLSDIHNPLPADSLIPMFEGMVDRALSRTSNPVAPGRDPQEAEMATPDLTLGNLNLSALAKRAGSKS